jgi:Tfp pilus assembly pilus retraction ATPase PilT
MNYKLHYNYKIMICQLYVKGKLQENKSRLITTLIKATLQHFSFLATFEKCYQNREKRPLKV